MSKVLVVGSKGRMGLRYCAIMKYMGIDFVEYDTNGALNPWSKDEVDRAIVATPIDDHADTCGRLLALGISVLCEKPISKSIDVLLGLTNVATLSKASLHMVNNWRFVLGRKRILDAGHNSITLNYFNTGADGDYDLIQPIYLSRGYPTISRTSPVYDCSVNGTLINQMNFDMSYVAMIDAWIHNPALMWTMSDAIAATEKTIKYMERNRA